MIDPKIEPCDTPQLIFNNEDKNNLLRRIGNALIDNFLACLIPFLVCRIDIVFLIGYCDQLS